nr:hypothetical protein [Bacteroidota bacterium]
MKAIIIEDEKLSAEYLTNLLKKLSSIEIIAVIDSVKKSLDFFSALPTADLLFVDVHLADGLSFEIFSKIAIDIPNIYYRLR